MVKRSNLAAIGCFTILTLGACALLAQYLLRAKQEGVYPALEPIRDFLPISSDIELAQTDRRIGINDRRGGHRERF
ncbi:hypothetical protein A2960_06560 [Candidatus Gottesmanbacteria bacterium RIFCSPLOWO2_01_FULL_39_12b]|uniref:Uncharacterized protein n=1 Tax=Candidatus Gottesmanbacteria bacterium RIFCSPLOWO2_01_FULL_39_12b TaxID=1798388 RepID=A0A1F6ARZ6_9BACT|nr:MAG: hypothetical protein A2960_06560 [Candidatus Gottesmanbacteria bacterium RIFCSPLOWO2_01_FULL_39_12b]